LHNWFVVVEANARVETNHDVVHRIFYHIFMGVLNENVGWKMLRIKDVATPLVLDD